MEYAKDFEKDFMKRTLEIVREYNGRYDATILVNCLLGLLVVPKERIFDRIPNEDICNIAKWGIKLDSIKKYGKCSCGDKHPKTLRQLVRSLRNSVAHFRITPIHADNKVSGYAFKDSSGFAAELSLPELSDFVQRLSIHFENDHS